MLRLVVALSMVPGCMVRGGDGAGGAQGVGQKYACRGEIRCPDGDVAYENSACIVPGTEVEFFDQSNAEIVMMECEVISKLRCEGPSMIAPVPCLLDE